MNDRKKETAASLQRRYSRNVPKSTFNYNNILMSILLIVALLITTFTLNQLSVRIYDNTQLIAKQADEIYVLQSIVESQTVEIQDLQQAGADADKKLLEAEKKLKEYLSKPVPVSSKAKPTKSVTTKATSTSTKKLTKRGGVNYFNGRKETWYSQRVLPGGGLKIPGRHVGAGGLIKDKDGYIVVAASDLPKGTVTQTSLGAAKVYDSGCAVGTTDIYTDW